MFDYRQPTLCDDLKVLLNRVKVIEDIISYNSTLALGEKYFVWIASHRELIEELEYMIKEDLEE